MILPEFVFPMKADEAEGNLPDVLARLEREGGWVAEAKLDGHRAQAVMKDGRLVAFTHDGRGSYAGRFPEVAAMLPAALPSEGVWVVDGELGLLEGTSGLRMDFRAVQSRAMMNQAFKIRVNSTVAPMTFVAFDLLRARGRDLTMLPYAARRAALERALRSNERVRLVETTPRLVAHYDLVCGLGGEGIMLKQTAAAYAVGKRSRAWLKSKAPRFLDNLHVVALLAGEGARSTSFGSLLLARRAPDGELDEVCKVGSGFSHADLVRVMDHAQTLRSSECPLRVKAQGLGREVLMWLRPGIRVDVEFDPPIPAQDGKPRVPRHPRLKNLHLD